MQRRGATDRLPIVTRSERDLGWCVGHKGRADLVTRNYAGLTGARAHCRAVVNFHRICALRHEGIRQRHIKRLRGTGRAPSVEHVVIELAWIAGVQLVTSL